MEERRSSASDWGDPRLLQGHLGDIIPSASPVSALVAQKRRRQVKGHFYL